MKFKILVLWILMMGLPCLVISQEWEWARQAGGSGVDHGQQVTISQDGTIYLTGTYSGTAVFGNDTLISNGKKDIFLSRFSSEGDLMWTIGFGTKEMDFSYHLAAGRKGGVFLTGGFSKTLKIDSTALSSSDGQDIFIAKFSGKGKLQWAKSLGGKGFDASFGLETDSRDHIYLLSTEDENPLDSLGDASKRYNTLRLSKLDSGGSVLWSYTTSGKNRIFGNALSLDQDGNIYITGEYRGEVIYNEDTLKKRYGVFVMKFDGSGDMVWQNTLGSNHIRSFGADLVADNDGHLYLTGGFDGIGQFGEDIMSSLGNLDIFIARLNGEDGSIEWVERAGGERMDKGMGICLAENGFYITGWYESWAHFGYDTTVVANGGNDFFIARYNTTGQLEWIDAPISKGLGYGKAIEGDGKGNFVCTGWFTGLVNFPSDLLVGTTRPDIYIAKFRDDYEE